jgi:hypothetical protein
MICNIHPAEGILFDPSQRVFCSLGHFSLTQLKCTEVGHFLNRVVQTLDNFRFFVPGESEYLE